MCPPPSRRSDRVTTETDVDRGNAYETGVHFRRVPFRGLHFRTGVNCLDPASVWLKLPRVRRFHSWGLGVEGRDFGLCDEMGPSPTVARRGLFLVIAVSFARI